MYGRALPLTWIKLNTDAAFRGNGVGCGWVLRDDDGRFLAAKNMCFAGSYSVNEGEALSVREALNWLMGIGMGNVEVEVDSQIVFNAVRSVPFVSAFGLLVGDIKELAATVGGVEFSFVRQSANCAAHAIAREAFSEPGRGEWFDIPPPFLVSCLDYDLMN
ncbi:PREDICTED: uncharacterized protein LOC109160428 [Ipomoea nil]|uniref:uncharacterized protein LOC109160428 n=1 Tax=Ipomoea nil TaxID=35883 RepID=UPI000901A61E|nr:PREDICTED: uncharacterized protein LOC109160428 [Ipomoea nil]